MKCDLRYFSVLLTCLAAGFTSVAGAAEGLKKLDSAESAELASVDDQSQSAEAELIQERYPDGQVKIERHVIRDLGDNYVNHGTWKKYDPSGNLVVEGQYLDGHRNGVWNAWYRAGEAAILAQHPFNQYKGPFVSQATFTQGKLDGSWRIFDGKQRKICQWSYAAGQRQGQWQWWLPSGKMMQEVTYKDGVADGIMKQFDADGEPVATIQLEDGRRLHEATIMFDSGQMKSKTSYLLARRVASGEDDWLTLHLAPYKTEGQDIKHGPSEIWYTNGQMQQMAEYDHGVESGEFTWWHKNSQVAVRGKYTDGKREGLWVWWHENGQKSIEGYFAADSPVQRWVYWSKDGRVSKDTSFADSGEEIVQQPRSAEKTASRPENTDSSSRRKPNWQ